MTAAEFLAGRRDFLQVTVVELEEGFDVVLRLDGTYAQRELAEEAAVGIARGVLHLSDIPDDGWDAWRPLTDRLPAGSTSLKRRAWTDDPDER
jgi:hypothetical protein